MLYGEPDQVGVLQRFSQMTIVKVGLKEYETYYANRVALRY